MTKTRTGRAALTALLTLPVLALVGCAVAATEAPASTRAVAPTSTATAAPQSEAADPVWPNDRCRDDQLATELVERPALSGAGQEGLAIVFTNMSEQSCSYFGSPGVLLLGADGTLLSSRDDSLGPAGSPGTTGEPTPGALPPGESIQVEGQLTAVDAYDCTPTTATTVRVLISGGSGIDVPSDLQVCADARSDLSIGSYIPAS